MGKKVGGLATSNALFDADVRIGVGKVMEEDAMEEDDTLVGNDSAVADESVDVDVGGAVVGNVGSMGNLGNVGADV